MKKFNYLLAMVILLITLSCSKDTVLEKSFGNLTIKITDAPMPYSQFMEVNVTIDKMEIGNSADMNSFMVLTDQQMKFNMLELVNGLTETMADTQIPEGEYNTIRLYISLTEMIMKNGDSFSYNMMTEGFSGNHMMQNGVMINSDTRTVDINLENSLMVSGGSQGECLLDIDIDSSFMLEGVNYVDMGMNGGMMMNMSGFTFMPNMRFVDMSTTGTIMGTVHSDTGNVENATIALMQNGSTYTSTHTDANGHFSLIGIPHGIYTINAEAEGYIMSPTDNEMNMGEINMMDTGSMNVDFMMQSKN